VSDFTGGIIVSTIEEILDSDAVKIEDKALKALLKISLSALSDDLDDGSYDPTDSALEAYEALDAHWSVQEEEEEEEEDDDDDDEEEDDDEEDV
jgi:hypothetical protein